MVTRVFLAAVGTLFLVLAIWCSLRPRETSEFAGLTLQPGSGDSEFLTIYGGLELALAILFWWPMFRPETTVWTLFACLVVNGCLVLFRTAGFFLYAGIPGTTYMLAGIEWAIFLGAAILWFKR